MFEVKPKEQMPTVSGSSQNRQLLQLGQASVPLLASVIAKGVAANGVTPSGAATEAIQHVAAGLRTRYPYLTVSELFSAFVKNASGELYEQFRYYDLPTYVNNIISAYYRHKMERAVLAGRALAKERQRKEMQAFNDENLRSLVKFWQVCRGFLTAPLSFADVLSVERRILRISDYRVAASAEFLKDKQKAVEMVAPVVNSYIEDDMSLSEWIGAASLTKSY